YSPGFPPALEAGLQCSSELDVRTRDRHTPAGLTAVTSNCSQCRQRLNGKYKVPTLRYLRYRKMEGRAGAWRAVRKEEGGRSTSLGQARRTSTALDCSCSKHTYFRAFLCRSFGASLPPLPSPSLSLPSRQYPSTPVPVRPCSSPPPRPFLFHFQLAAASASVRHPSKEITTLLSSFFPPLFPSSPFLPTFHLPPLVLTLANSLCPVLLLFPTFL
ncbi:hypothetical protein BDP55DRAFT_738357, partial [Colletotrichum godetiae]